MQSRRRAASGSPSPPSRRMWARRARRKSARRRLGVTAPRRSRRRSHGCATRRSCCARCDTRRRRVCSGVCGTRAALLLRHAAREVPGLARSKPDPDRTGPRRITTSQERGRARAREREHVWRVALGPDLSLYMLYIMARRALRSDISRRTIGARTLPRDFLGLLGSLGSHGLFRFRHAPPSTPSTVKARRPVKEFTSAARNHAWRRAIMG